MATKQTLRVQVKMEKKTGHITSSVNLKVYIGDLNWFQLSFHSLLIQVWAAVAAG